MLFWLSSLKLHTKKSIHMQNKILIAFATFASLFFAIPAFSQPITQSIVGCPDFHIEEWPQYGYESPQQAIIAQGIQLQGIREIYAYRNDEKTSKTNLDSLSLVMSPCWDSLLRQAEDSTALALREMQEGIMSSTVDAISLRYNLSKFLRDAREGFSQGKKLTDGTIWLTQELNKLKHEDSLTTLSPLAQLTEKINRSTESMRRNTFSPFLISDTIAFQKYMALLDTAKVLKKEGKLSESCRVLFIGINRDSVDTRIAFDQAVNNFWNTYHTDTEGMLLAFLLSLNDVNIPQACNDLMPQIVAASQEETTKKLIKEIDNFWLCLGGLPGKKE